MRLVPYANPLCPTVPGGLSRVKVPVRRRACARASLNTMPDIPTHCWAAAAVVVGASVVATTLHSDSKVPTHCIGASMLGSATVASALVHHGSLTQTPAWYCVVGGVAGASAIGYSLTARLHV